MPAYRYYQTNPPFLNPGAPAEPRIDQFAGIIVRDGSPLTPQFPATAFGSAAGQTINFGENSAYVIQCMLATLVASATVGNRNIALELQDGAGIPVFRTGSTASLTASSTWFISFGEGLPANVIGPGNQIWVPFPGRMLVPPGAKFRLFDAANISTADTIALNALISL